MSQFINDRVKIKLLRGVKLQNDPRWFNVSDDQEITTEQVKSLSFIILIYVFFFLLQVSDHFRKSLCKDTRRQRNLGEFVFAILLREILQRCDLIGVKDVQKPEKG